MVPFTKLAGGPNQSDRRLVEIIPLLVNGQSDFAPLGAD
jgi:hypothetical protein